MSQLPGRYPLRASNTLTRKVNAEHRPSEATSRPRDHEVFHMRQMEDAENTDQQ